jgi:hypothetical protein
MKRECMMHGQNNGMNTGTNEPDRSGTTRKMKRTHTNCRLQINECPISHVNIEGLEATVLIADLQVL